LSRCAIEPAESPAIRKPPRRKEITTQVWEGLLDATHVSVDPEPTAGRNPPALLAFLFLFTGTNWTELSWLTSLVCAFNRVDIPCVLFGNVNDLHFILMASALYFGFFPKVQHGLSNR
jgi:hypothetical protein